MKVDQTSTLRDRVRVLERLSGLHEQRLDLVWSELWMLLQDGRHRAGDDRGCLR